MRGQRGRFSRTADLGPRAGLASSEPSDAQGPGWRRSEPAQRRSGPAQRCAESGDVTRPHLTAASDVCRPGLDPGRGGARLEGRATRPAMAHRIPVRPTVGVGDWRPARHAGGQLTAGRTSAGAQQFTPTANTWSADEATAKASANGCPALVSRPSREGEPRRNPHLDQERHEDLGFADVRNRLHGEEVGEADASSSSRGRWKSRSAAREMP